MEVADPEAVSQARRQFMQAVARRYRTRLEGAFRHFSTPGPYSPDAASAGRRAMRNAALGYVCSLDDDTSRALAFLEFRRAENMTDAMAALTCLANSAGAERGRALQMFFDKWKDFQFNQPYAKGLARLKGEVLGKTYFDPATLWQWGTIQAMALIEILRSCERTFGAEGLKLVYEALHRIGLDVGRQILAGTTVPEDMTEVEFVSFYATVINRIAYASLEAPKIWTVRSRVSASLPAKDAVVSTTASSARSTGIR
jgi:aminopeptidase N